METLFKTKTKLEISLEVIKKFQPLEGYYVAFSGGKDSVCIAKLCELAQVKYELYYNVTGIDPPEVVMFIKKYYPQTHFELPQKTMWQLIKEMGIPPTRLMRYCCKYLKEYGGENRLVITGIRKAESVRRLKTREIFEQLDIKRVLNPILDWTEKDVWNFIKAYHLPYCKLYDEGWKRIGCIGCPMGSKKQRLMQFKKYPVLKEQYLRAFKQMLETRKSRKNLKTTWKTPEEVLDWWIYGKGEVLYWSQRTPLKFKEVKE